MKNGCNSFGPKPIWSPDFRSPTSCPHGQMVPKNLVPMDKWSPNNLVPNRFGPPGQMVPKNLVPILPNHHSLSPWTNRIFWVPFVHGDRIGWKPFVQRDQLIWDQLWGTKCLGTICVWDQMCHSRYLRILTLHYEKSLFCLFFLKLNSKTQLTLK